MPRRAALIQALLVALIVGGLSLATDPAAPLRAAALAVAAAATIGIFSLLHRRAFLDPLRRIHGRVDALAAGDLAGKVYVGTGGEVATLARSINSLSASLAARFQQLEGDRRRLEGILSGLVEGVIALDGRDQIIFANARAGLVLEFSPERAVGRKFWEVIRHRPLVDLVQSAVNAREPRRLDMEWQGAATRSLGVYAAPLAGESSGLIVVIHDVSELRRLERLRQEFVANVSHELKTPLAVIRASAETLADGAADDPVHRKAFLDQIAEQSDRLHALILDLLALARIEGSATPLEPIVVPLQAAVAEAIDRHGTRAAAKQITLVHPDGPPAEAWAESESVDVMLDNLIDNAIKYTGPGGTITVRHGAGPADTWLEVSDTGIGIPPADLPRVFERFYRVDKARSRELGGTGLGLAIVKHLAQANGGSVSARSEPGRGTTFTVRLPIARS